ncbi:class I SAM-dependent methyltransferase [Planctomycetota bacterium]
MKNAKMSQMTHFVAKGHVNEIPYHFEAGPKLQEVMGSRPAGSKVAFEKKPGNIYDIQFLSGDPAGWRVKAGPWLLYLSLEAGDSISQTTWDTHWQLLGLMIYYPANADIIEYWQKPDDTANKTEAYADDSALKRSAFLAACIAEHCPGISSAIEIGCNLGRNLNYLQSELNLAVAGMEISRYALSLMPQIYPDLKVLTIYAGPVQKTILDIPDNSYDLVFSMAVLMHLHPTTPDEFWAEVPRIAAKHVLIIENEIGGSPRNWARNYQTLFEKYGARQIHTEPAPQDIPEFQNYTARIFVVEK